MKVDVPKFLVSDKTTESIHDSMVQPVVALVRGRGNEVEIAPNEPRASAERTGVAEFLEKGRLVLMAMRPVDTG